MSVGWPQALDERYTLLRPLSDGVLARVYAARDRKHPRDVAIKILRVEHGDVDLVTRFLNEVQIVAQLSHPHILPLFDSGDVDGAPYFVMPLVGGTTLRRRLEDEGPLSLPIALSIARQIAAALDYAHQHGVVHRDIKPENVLLEGREVRVTDFGIAAALGAPTDDRITRAGMVVGTPRYMSPEQAAGDPDVDGRSDLYSLGLVLFEMLTGVLPYPAMFSAAGAEPLPLASVRAHRDDVPADVDAAIAKAIARDRNARTSSAREFIDALAGFGAERDVHVAPATTVNRWRRRHTVVAAVALVAILGGLASRPLWRAESAPAPRRWILVADFDAESSDRANAVAMRELALTELAQSADFSIVPSEHVSTARRNAGIPDSIPISGEIARELATRTTVRVVVEGGIRRVGAAAWALTMRAVSAEDGAVLVASSAEATDASLVRELGALARRVRAGLGEHTDDLLVTRALQDVSTASFPAFLRYQEALTRARTADYDAAVHLTQQALALDSSFASAWVSLANLYVSLQHLDSAKWAFEKAAALPARLSDADRDRLAGDMAFYIGFDPVAGVRGYDRFLALRPASLSGHNNRALFLSALGRHREALAGFRDAASVDPLSVGPRNIQLLNIATELVVLGHLDSAEIASRPLTGSHRQYLTMLALNASDDWDSLATVATEVLAAPAPPRFAAFPARLHRIGALEALGRRREADAWMTDAMARARGSDLRWVTHARLLLDAARGERPSWPLPTEIRDGRTAASCLLRGLHAAQRGDLRERASVAQCLSRLDATERAALGHGPVYLLAWQHLAEGRADSALTLILPAAEAGEHHPFSVDRVSTIALRLVQARSLAGLGRIAEAEQALASAQRARGLPPNHIPLRGLAARAVLAPSGRTTMTGSSGR